MRRFLLIPAVLMCAGYASFHLLDAWCRNAGYLSLVRGNVAAASDWFGRSTESSLGTSLGRARTSVLTRRFDAAEWLLRSVPYRPDMMMPAWLLSVASKFLESGDAVEARRTLDLVPCATESELCYRLGLLYERAGAEEEARKAFVAGAEHDRSGMMAKGWYYLARSRYLAGEWDRVIDLLTPRLSGAPGSDLDVDPWREGYLFLAGSLEHVGQRTEAQSTYRELVARDPASRDWVMHFAQLRLGYEDLERGNWLPALGRFVIAYESAAASRGLPREYEERAWQGMADLAGVIAAQGRIPESLTFVQQSVLVDPMNPGWRVLMGVLFEITCEIDGAREAYAGAQELVPESAYLRGRLVHLDQKQRECSQ